MRRIQWGEENAMSDLDKLPFAGEKVFKSAEEKVSPILDNVRHHGDIALKEYTKKFDFVDLDAEDISVPEREIQGALESLTSDVRDALLLAEERIRAFHEACLPKEIEFVPAPGERFILRPIQLERVGLYVPGGRAAYPSTVLMSAIPAKAAGVKEIIMCSPPNRKGAIARSVLAAAALSGVTRIFRVGGAQAIGAMAYGTITIAKVDKIVGPGNIFVSAAKRLVRNVTEVDKDAGPSEVVVVLDDSRHAEWAAADLLAQAEHDPAAMAVGVAVGTKVADQLEAEVERQVATALRREVISDALKDQGAIVEVATREEALAVADRLAPEHLELMVEHPGEAAAGIRNAGAILCGPWSAAPFGDYLAGPNHVLPTGKTARFASPLGVFDFLKWSSITELGPEAASRLAGPAAALADLEGFPAHARSLRLRASDLPR